MAYLRVRQPVCQVTLWIHRHIAPGFHVIWVCLDLQELDKPVVLHRLGDEETLGLIKRSKFKRRDRRDFIEQRQDRPLLALFVLVVYRVRYLFDYLLHWSEVSKNCTEN